MFANIRLWSLICSPESLRYMNMIINFPPLLIGAYEKSVRSGKYGYDGWLGPTAAVVRAGWCAGLCGSLCTECSYSIDSTHGHHPVVTQHPPPSLPHWLAHVRSMPGTVLPWLAVPYDSCITAYIAVSDADHFKLYAVLTKMVKPALDTHHDHSPLLLKTSSRNEKLTSRLYAGIKSVST